MIEAEVRPLHELPAALDRSLLHVFVVGPGRGEGIAVALPEHGWLAIDGAVADIGRPTIIEILERWKTKEEKLEWAVLSHPHDDHVDGFADTINAHPPVNIALAGVEGAPRYIDILKDAKIPAPSDDALKAVKVRAAFRAIRTWESVVANKPATGVSDASPLLIDRGGVTLRVLSPPAGALGTYLNACAAKPEYLKSDANRHSIVLELTFGNARIVLPGDLPRTVKSRSVSPGWNDLAAHHARLAAHAVLKVAHHGSAEAIHIDVMTAGDADRAWVITPYNSARLPSVADADGLPEIVSKRRRVFLTGVPASKSVQGSAVDGVVSLEQLASRIASQPLGAIFKDTGGVEITPGTAREPLDCVWCFVVKSNGNVAGIFRGAAALEVRQTPGVTTSV